jgi:hypothetical protein
LQPHQRNLATIKPPCYAMHATVTVVVPEDLVVAKLIAANGWIRHLFTERLTIYNSLHSYIIIIIIVDFLSHSLIIIFYSEFFL